VTKIKQVLLDAGLAASGAYISSGIKMDPKTMALVACGVELAKAVYPLVVKLRATKADEFVLGIIKDQELLDRIENYKEQEFADAFAYALEKYIRERNEAKRLIMSKVFGDGIKVGLEAYPLERLYSIVERLTFKDVDVFKEVVAADGIRIDLGINYISQEATLAQNAGNTIRLSEIEKAEILYALRDKDTEQAIADLINDGLVVRLSLSGGWSSTGISELRLTALGTKFAQFLNKVPNAA
jgi:hypothetical protein